MADGQEVSQKKLRTSSSVKKIRVVGNACVGATGDPYDCETFMDWWEAKQRNPKIEYISHRLSDTFEGMVIYADGTIETYCDRSSSSLKTFQAPFAIGGGCEIALGAMHAGADAKRAVEICCQIDPGCGGEIMIVTLEELQHADSSDADQVLTLTNWAKCKPSQTRIE